MAIYFVKPASVGGDDGNDGTTFALAKATLLAAWNLCSNGDYIRVCSSESAPFTGVSVILPTKHNIVLVGADLVDGSAYKDNTRAVISGTGTYVLYFGTAVPGFKAYNISFRGTSSTYGIYVYTSGAVGLSFFNCEFKNLRYGTNLIGSSTYAPQVCYFNCVFDTCISGLYLTSYPYFSLFCFSCIFKNNSYGISISTNNTSSWNTIGSSSLVVDECRFISNSVGVYSTGGFVAYYNRCVFYLNSISGISLNTPIEKMSIINTIFHSNNYAATSSDVSTGGTILLCADYNCFYNNTSGNFDVNLEFAGIPGSNNIFNVDPKFASTTLGAEDFRLQEDSPCLGIGTGYVSGQ